MKMVNYTLPEFVFLDGNSHTGNTLDGRTVLQHIRTYTILEVIATDDMLETSIKTKTHAFDYKNNAGIVEKHMFALHFTLADDGDLPEIFALCEKWYCAYLHWEDRNIATDEVALQN
jgi:hypothetical protein